MLVLEIDVTIYVMVLFNGDPSCAVLVTLANPRKAPSPTIVIVPKD